jgi:CO/xanthine dehydrogenase Mo-binding subunit
LKINGNNPRIENADVDLRIIVNPDAAKKEGVRNGEALFPPVFAAVANALYKAIRKRYYDQLLQVL